MSEQVCVCIRNSVSYHTSLAVALEGHQSVRGTVVLQVVQEFEGDPHPVLAYGHYSAALSTSAEMRRMNMKICLNSQVFTN